MLNEYNCWLQERKITSVVLPEGLAFDKIFITTSGEIAEPAAGQAVEEFRRGIKRLLGSAPVVSPNMATAESGVFLKLAPRGEAGTAGIKSGGFTIRLEKRRVFIIGQDEPGLLYGVFRFLALLAQGKIQDGFETSDAPVSPIRMIDHWDNFDGTIERGYAGQSLFYRNGKFDYDSQRVEDYARLLASVGINRISINNVNVRDEAKLLITEEYLTGAAALAGIFRRFGIRVFIAINFASPLSLGKLPTADPLDPDVARWWKERAALIYKYIPDLAGFIVKADSEGEPGPLQYSRSHADGANMLAKAVKPHGGEIIWRCFVYDCQQDWRDRSFDRVRAAYDHFKPLDGSFADNVILQIKFGPLDFQVSEPVSPLFGALQKTRHIMELQITQEYTGQQIDLCYLPYVWEDIMNFDTAEGGAPDGGGSPDGCRIKTLIERREAAAHIEGFAAVTNVGLDRNWTGNTLAQANLYGYGRMAWNPNLTAQEIALEWSVLSFGGGTHTGGIAQSIAAILMESYPAYAKYTAPFGIGFMVTPKTHYGPNIEGHEYSRWGTYHRADSKAIGIDRTPKGTGFTDQYAPQNAAMFADPAACPENLLLFFHRLPYDYMMKNGQTLLQNIYDTHFEGYDAAAAMVEKWKGLINTLETNVYESVLAHFEKQMVNAAEWRDQINTYFFRKTGVPDAKNRQIYP